MQKAYAYLRVSSKGQLKGDGPERQRSEINRYCKTNRIDIVGWYTESESGTELNRPQLARLIIDLEKNSPEIKTVVIEKLDRLARKLIVQELTIEEFERLGVQLISALEGPELDSDNPDRNFMRQIRGAAAEYNKAMLVLRLRAARQRKREREGKCEGAKAYGETSEAERRVVKRIKLMRRRRKGGYKPPTYREIADRLNAEGIKTKKDKKWTAQLVHHVCTKL